MIQSHHMKKKMESNVVLACPSIIWLQILDVKKIIIIIEWYICKDRELENTFRNNSIFEESKLSSINFRDWIMVYHITK